jgi:biotin carboxylase
MAKVLLVDTNVSSSPIYKYLRNTGHEVFVVGSNPNDFLAKCTDRYIPLDYSDVSALHALINELSISYLIPGCNDVSYKVCAQVNKDGHFPGIDTLSNNEILNNKKSYRVFAQEHQLPVPRVYCNDHIGDIRFPIIVKPVDAFSGHGITIVHDSDPRHLEAAIAMARHHSKSESYLIEDFVSGQLHSHSAFIADGKVLTDFIVEEHCTANSFAVDTSRVLSDFPTHELQILRFAAEKMATMLRLKDGLLHTQFLWDGKSVWLIEPTRRCPGDLYSRLIELSTGVNYAENYTRPFLGLTHQFSTDTSIKSLVMRHTVTDRSGGNFWTLRFPKTANVFEFVALSRSGDPIKVAPAGRIGILFIGANTPEEFEQVYRRTIARELYNCTED